MMSYARIGFLAAVVVLAGCSRTLVPAPPVPPLVDQGVPSTNEVVRVNCGGPEYVDRSNRVFQSDAAFTVEQGWGCVGGEPSSARGEVATLDTEDPQLFITDRWGVGEYRFQMKPGVYRVTMYFSEFHFAEAGKRVFDVSINGRPVVKALDIVERVGQNHAYQVSAIVLAEDGRISIAASDIADRCKFSALSVEPAERDQVPPPVPALAQVYDRDREIGIEWAGVEAEDLKGYFIYRADRPDGPFHRLNKKATPFPYYVDRALANGRSYFYRVAAVDFFDNESGQGVAVEGKPRVLAARDYTFGINTGGGETRDWKGRRYAADREYNAANGSGYLTAARVRAGQDVTEPSASVREGPVAYRMDLPPGIYQVTLGFYDAWSHEAKDRVFHARLNRFRACTDLDLVALYGAGVPTEVTRIFRVGAEGLDITLAPKHGLPLLSFIYVEPAEADATAPDAPTIARQIARDGIVYLEWPQVAESDVVGYTIYRAGGSAAGFAMVTGGLIGVTSYVDTSVTNGQTYRYEVSATDASGNEGPASREVSASPHEPGDDELLDIIERAAFEYFAIECDPKSYLTKDKNVSEEISIAATGFGLSSYAIGAERGWMSKEEAGHRAYTILHTLNGRDDNKESGIFYHYLKGDGSRGEQGYEDAVSTVDTALLMAGALGAGEYFGGPVKEEADLMMSRMNWRVFADDARTLLAMAYRPAGKKFDGAWDYYTDEALLITLLGISAPKEEFRLDPKYFYRFKRERRNYKGITNIVCSWSGSLFTYTFAHCWLDFEKLGPDNPESLGLSPALQVDWWQNSIRAIQANREYCIALSQKFQTFGEQAWGLSASSGPGNRYVVAGAPPCGDAANSGEGTLAPYGAGMAMAFLPTEAMAALKNYYSMRGPDGQKVLWRDEFDGGYGFIDSYNKDKKFFSKEVQGIDQGPMLLLIENHRSGLLWKTMLKNESLRAGLARVGFRLPQ